MLTNTTRELLQKAMLPFVYKMLQNKYWKEDDVDTVWDKMAYQMLQVRDTTNRNQYKEKLLLTNKIS